MLSLHWLSRLWQPRRGGSVRSSRVERLKERRLKLMRLEQRRVLNADFSFTSQSLTLGQVDGDLAVREVSSGLTSHIEFDLHGGSVWQDDGSTGTFAIDNSTPGHSILSIAKSDFENMSAGASLSAASSAFDLHFDVQSSTLDLGRMRGTLVAEGFGNVSQTAAVDHEVKLVDVSLSAGHISLSRFHGDDITLRANEIDLDGGSGTFAGSTLSIFSAAAPAIELGGLNNDGVELNFTGNDIAALGGGFSSVHFSTLQSGDSATLTVDESGADFYDALAPHTADGPAGRLQLEAATVQIHGDLTSGGGLIEVHATEEVTLSDSGQVVSHGGRVLLDAGQHGTLLLSGRVDVSDSDMGAAGGTVHLLGERVGLFGEARIDASGDTAGGEVLIGGDEHGANDAVRNSSAVWIGSDVEVRADALRAGSGGKIVAWSDDVTQVFGSLSARGGWQSGDGGLIETSSLGQLLLSGSGDASAANGQGGTWLLDPYNVGIRHTLSGFGVDDSGQLPSFTPTSSGSEVTDTAIEAQLNAGTSVVISTANGTGGEAGNVTQTSDAAIDVVFTAAGNSATFTINAANNIVLNGGITVSNGTLDVALNANTPTDDPDLGSGDVAINAAINTNGGTFSSSGVSFDNSSGTITATGGANLSQTGTVVLGAIDTGAESLAVTAGSDITGGAALSVGGNAHFETGGGHITLAAAGSVNFGTLTFVATGVVQIAEDDGTQLSGLNTAGSLILSSGDALVDDPTASLTVVGNAQFNATTITLDDFHQFGSLTFVSAGAVEITESDATLLSGSSTAGSLVLRSSDAINNDSTASVSVAEAATFIGTRVTLGDQPGDSFNFGTLAFTSLGAVSIAEDSSSVLNGTSSALSLSLVSSSEITNEGQTQVTIDNNASFSGTLITLGDQPGDILRSGSLTFASAGAVQIIEDSDIVLSGDNFAASLSLRSSDTISSDGTANVVVEDNAMFDGTRITLQDFNQFGSLTFVSGGDVAITEANATLLEGTSTALSLSLSSSDSVSNQEAASVAVENNASLSGNGITLGDRLGDALNFGTLTVTSAGDVQIAEDSDILLSGTSSARKLNLSSTDVIFNDGSARIAVVDNATFSGTNIDLGNQSGDALSFGTLTFVADGFVRIASDSASVLSGVSAAVSLDLSSDTEISNDGTAIVIIAGNANFSGASITLDDIHQFGSLTFQSNGAVVIAEADATLLSGISTALSLNLASADTLGNDGSAEVSVENNASFSGLNISLDDTYRFGSLTFASAGAVAITEADDMLLDGNSTANSLSLVSSVSITEEVGGTLSVAETTDLIGFSGSVLLDGANDFGGVVTLHSGDAATLNDVNSVTLGDSTVAALFSVTANDSIILEGHVAASSASWFAANGSISGGGQLTAATVDLDASAGMFGVTSDDSLSLSAVSIAADNSGAFNVNLSNDNVLDVSVTSLTTFGGDLAFSQLGFGSVTFVGRIASGDQSSAVPVTGGGITLSSTGGLIVAALDEALSSESGTGGSLSLSGATIQRAITVGAGDITIHGAGDDLLITADISANATIELSATGDVIITSTITADGATSDLTITADSDLDGVGGFWLNEAPSATDARLNAGQNIAIQGANLLATSAGGDGIRIDGDSDTQQVVAGGDLLLSTSGSAASSNSGDIIINGRQSAEGSITVSSNSDTFLGADQTAGTEMLLQSAVRLSQDLTLTTGGDLTFAGTLDDDGSSATGSALTIDAGEDVIFGAAVGAIVGDRLDTLTVADSESVEFRGTLTIDGDVEIVTTLSSGATAGTISFVEEVTTTAGLASGSVRITNSGVLVIAADADFSLSGAFAQDGNGSTELGGDITTANGGITFEQSLLLTESVRLDSSVRHGDILFLGPIDSEGSAGSGEHNSLTLTSGTGTTSFNGDIGAGNLGDQELGNLTLESAGLVLFGGADAGGPGTTGPVTTIATDGVINIGVGDHVIAGGIVLNAGSGTLVITTTDDAVRFNGPVTLASQTEINTNASGVGGAVTFTSSATIDSQFGESNGLTIDAGTQRVLFNNDIGLINAIGALTITQADSGVIFGESDANQGPGSTGPVTTLAAEGAIDIGVGTNVIVGGIVFNAGSGTLQISAADETARFNGAVTLNSNVRINTNVAGFGGTVTFTSDTTIDSQSGEHHDLTIDAGTQQVLFNNDLGAVESLGALTITQADGGVIFGESDTNLGPGTTGPMTTISTDGAIDIGVAEHVITGGIVLNAGSGTLVVKTTDDSVRFNGPVTLATHVDINTNDAGIGGTVTFSNTATIDSEIGEHNDLRINAGTQQVQFNNDIGAVQSLGALTITQADSGVTFGQPVTFGASDVDQRPGTTGPVSIVNTDDAIDIGVGSHVIGGSGIVFNAGVDMLTITTTDDAVRLNGAVTLATGVSISTNATGLGGSVTFTSAATIDSQTDEHNDLLIDAGSQQVLFNNNLGAVQSLGVFTILQADSGVFFGEADTDQGPGTIGPVSIISTDGAIDIGVADNVIAGSGIVFNAGTQTLQITTTDDTVRFNGAVSLLSSLDIDTNFTALTGGGTVMFTSATTIDGDFGEFNSLTLDVGTQQVLFNNDIGNHDPIGALTITQADGGVVFGQADTDQGPGTTGPVTTLITEGAIDIGVGANVITGGIVLNAGLGTLLVRTTDDTARFNGPVTLSSAVEITTNLTPLTGGGTVTFTSAATIDSQTNEHNDLTIDAGSQQVLFNNNVGLSNPIGALVITQADAGVIFGQTDTDLGPGTTGPVATVATDGEINIGVGPNVVTGGILLNAGTGTLTITTTDDPVRFNGPVTLQTDVDINSNINALSTGGGTVTFTSAATIDSQATEHNDLTIDAGTERVLFNNNLGATQSLGFLTITQADGGVIFGETDTDEGPGTTGPVTTINTDDAIDIGVGANVIQFGIVLNAGIDEFGVQRTQQITTTDDTIRFNGPVTLSTAVDIDTDFTAITGGATVTFTSGATIDSQADEHNDLTIDVGTQQVLFNNDVGGVFSLGAFTITQADSGVIFGEADADLGPGTIGPVRAISTDRAIDIGVGANFIDGAVGIVFNAGTEALRVMTTDDTVRFNGAATLNSPVEIDTNFEILTGGGTVRFTSNTTLDSQADEFNDLSIDAGIFEVLFNNNLGATQPLGAFTIVQADGGVTFGESDLNAGPGTVGPVTMIATDGAIDIGVLGNVINGSIVLNGGADLLLLTTTDAPVRFNGQVTLASHVSIDTNDTGFGGTVTFTSSGTIDSQASERRDLTIDAGAQQVLFNNNLGENVPLGTFTITQADGGITFGESKVFEFSELGIFTGPGTTGPVSTVTADGPIDLGVDDNVIFGGIVLNAGTVPIPGELPLITIESNFDRIRINGPVTSFVDVLLRAAEGITLTDDADITTTDHNIEILGDTDDTRFDDPFTDAIAMSFDTFIDAGDGYIRMQAASILLGRLISTNSGATTDEHPAVHVTATTGAITDINSDVAAGADFVNITANALPTVAGLEVSLTNLDTMFDVSDINVTLDIPFVVQIEQEQMLVTAISGDTLTVTRGINGTTAVTHTGSIATPITVFAVTPGAGVVLEAVTGIGSGNALETEVDTLQARNLDSRDAGGGLLVPALGNIQIVEVPSGGSLNLINVRNEANATFDADPDNGVVDVLVERDPDLDLGTPVLGAIDGSLTVLDDELGAFDATDVPYGLLAELKGDPALLVIPEDRMGVQSENIIRLTAFNVTINDDVLAVVDADGGTSYETIEIRARGDFSLAANRVISTDNSFVNSLPQGDPTTAEPVGGDPVSVFPVKPRVTDDRVRIVADFDNATHADAGNVFLGRSATISTDAGIEQLISRRPAPNEAGTAFFDSKTVHASDLNSNGIDSGGSKYLGFLTITIGKPGEKNLILDIDWGDTPRSSEDFDEFPKGIQDLLTSGVIKDFNAVREAKISDEVGSSANVLSDSNVNPPFERVGKFVFDQIVDKDKTRYFIPEGGLTYVIPHEYSSMALNRPNDLREPGRFFPSDPFQVRFSVSQHASINIQGRAIHEHTIGPAAAAPLAAVGSSSPIAPLALLSSTDILEDNSPNDHSPDIDYTVAVINSTPDFYRDEANFRLNSGVAEFNVPTTKALTFIDNTQPVRSPEQPRSVARDSTDVTAPQLTTESLRGSAATSSVTTDEFFELRLIPEDGSFIPPERLKDGEGLLERERFEEFVRNRGDGDYEVWFITREQSTGARIERQVIQFRLEGGRLTPPANDSLPTFKPLRLVPVPEAPPQALPENDDVDDQPSEFDVSDAAIQVPESALDSRSAGADQIMPELPQSASDRSPKSDEPGTAETGISQETTCAAAGVLVFSGTRWWQSRFSQRGTSRFSLAARLARKRLGSSDDV